jgi:putative aldouronate transport system substrate-binding protein
MAIAVLLIGSSGLAAGAKKEGPQATAGSVRVINMLAPSLGPVPQGLQAVENAINAITESAINVKVNYVAVEVGSYPDQLNLMISSGEKLDLVLTLPAGPAGFNIMISQNQLMDIGPFIGQYGTGIVRAVNDVMPNMLNGTTVNKKILGVTGLYNKVTSYYWCLRDDILRKHNIDVSGVKTVNDMETILQRLKAVEPNISAILPSSSDGAVFARIGALFLDTFDRPVIYDFLGDQVGRIGVSFMDDPYRVVNLYKSEPYRRVLERTYRWYQNGYIYRDSVTNTEMAEELVKSGKGISWISESEIGVEANKSAQTGYPIRAIRLNDQVISTGNIRKFVWAVPSTSREPEAAVKFLNLMYTDPQIVNLLTWGIEGRDYESKADGTIGYPAGVTAQTVGYHSADFLFGNQYLCKVWEGNPASLRQEALALNKNAVQSEVMGFSFDTSQIANEVTATTNVINQYRPSLESGTIDPARDLPNFIRDLDAAGAERIIAEIQRQIDAWRAAR